MCQGNWGIAILRRSLGYLCPSRSWRLGDLATWQALGRRLALVVPKNGNAVCAFCLFVGLLADQLTDISRGPLIAGTGASFGGFLGLFGAFWGPFPVPICNRLQQIRPCLIGSFWFWFFSVSLNAAQQGWMVRCDVTI